MTHPQPILLETGTVLKGMHPSSPYVIQAELPRSGMHGRSYVALADDGNTVFIKIPFIDLTRTLDVQHDRSIRIFGSFLKEYRNRAALEDVKGVAHILDAGFMENEGRLVPFLVQEYIDGDGLEDYLTQKFGRSPSGRFRGMPNASDWFDLSRKMLQIIRRVHNRFVVHGDIWPANWMMRDDEPVLVDFGQSFIIDDYPDELGGRTRHHPYLAPERAYAGRRWDMSADIYSIGGLLMYLATGEEPFEPEEDVERLKSLVHEKIDEANPELLKQNMGLTKVIDKCMRHNVVDRYPYVDDVIEALDLFDYERVGTARSGKATRVVAELRRSMTALRDAPSSHLFQDLAEAEINVLIRQIEGMSRGHLILTAEREALINSLLRYLRVLDGGDEYLTVTVPAFWSPENLGVNGRFLTLNQMMAQKGVLLKRVFLLCDEDRNDQATMDILNAHLRAMREVESGLGIGESQDQVAVGWYTGFVMVSEEERLNAMAANQHVAVWKKRESGELMSITFSQRPGTGQIGKVRFWTSPHLRAVVEQFDQRIRESSPLVEFMNK